MQVLKQNSLLKKIGEIADHEKVEVYAVGGVVRDELLGRECKDIDFVIVGDGPSFAKAVAKKCKQNGQPFIKNLAQPWWYTETIIWNSSAHAKKAIAAIPENLR